jgi:hypothetical protein
LPYSELSEDAFTTSKCRSIKTQINRPVVLPLGIDEPDDIRSTVPAIVANAINLPPLAALLASMWPELG